MLSRLLILVLVAGAATLGFVLARRHDRVATSVGGRFLCPMHVEVTAERAGECPICGMALVEAGALARESSSTTWEDSSAEDTIPAARILSRAAGGIAPNLVGYFPSPLRQHVLRYEVFAPAWVESGVDLAVLVYGDQVPTLEPGEIAEFSPTADPDLRLEVALDPSPATAWDPSLARVRFVLPATARMPPGTVGWVRFAARPRQMQVIPALALLEAPEGPYVLVIAPDRGTATRRPIAVGRIVTGLAAVLSGLDLREQVVSVNAFFWDAERRLQAERRAGGSGDTPR